MIKLTKVTISSILMTCLFINSVNSMDNNNTDISSSENNPSNARPETSGEAKIPVFSQYYRNYYRNQQQSQSNQSDENNYNRQECKVCTRHIDLNETNNTIIQLNCCNNLIHLNCIKIWIGELRSSKCPWCNENIAEERKRHILNQSNTSRPQQPGMPLRSRQMNRQPQNRIANTSNIYKALLGGTLFGTVNYIAYKYFYSNQNNSDNSDNNR